MKISTGTIARTIVLFLALLNQICAIIGWTPVEILEEDIYRFVTLATTVGASIWAFWKNNSFTVEARRADQTLKELRGK